MKEEDVDKGKEGVRSKEEKEGRREAVEAWKVKGREEEGKEVEIWKEI